MIYHKISFLIVLISVVCFSADVKTPEEALQDNENCHNAMNATFVGINTPTECIQHGIMYMKLYGANAFLYDKHLEMYYKLFYKSLHIDGVILPEEFCKRLRGVGRSNRSNRSKCNEKLKIFLDPPTFPVITDSEEQIEEGISQSNPGSSQNRFGISQSNPGSSQNRFVILDSSISQINPGSSQNDFGISVHNVADVNPVDPEAEIRRAEDILKRNVLKNALYLHVIYQPAKGYPFPNDQESRNYFHDVKSYGYPYLTEIARLIKLKEDSLTSPSDYCDTIYRKDLNDIEEEKIRRSFDLP